MPKPGHRFSTGHYALAIASAETEGKANAQSSREARVVHLIGEGDSIHKGLARVRRLLLLAGCGTGRSPALHLVNAVAPARDVAVDA
jgi:hypothetical protein